MPEPIQPKRGEIWLANFDPTLGTEIKKIRPAVILSCRLGLIKPSFLTVTPRQLN
jgi:mRNA-degrading endonuclease toxin of MazEF toxin-antitoxin module